MNLTMVALVIAIPLGVAFLIPLVARRLSWLADVLGNVATVGTAVSGAAAFGNP